MAKIQHLYSITAGNQPTNILRGQVAINIPDQLVYADDPIGRPRVISSGVQGVANASGLLGVHIPTAFYPVAQFGVGMTQTDVQGRFTDDGTTATLLPVPIFVFGKLWWTQQISCPSSPAGAYSITIDTVNRACSMSSVPSGSGRLVSGVVNHQTGVAVLVFYSDATIYPWFYLEQAYGSVAGGAPSNVYRISPVKTFGSIPVSQGFAGAAATSYWGH